MITIITAIYNQRAVNELFFDALTRHTFYPFELIIIDNGSTDGSGDFFNPLVHVSFATRLTSLIPIVKTKALE